MNEPQARLNCLGALLSRQINEACDAAAEIATLRARIAELEAEVAALKEPKPDA